MTISPGKHGVIVIHGIGDDMKPGNLLADVTNSLADALMESPENDVKPEIRREADLSGNPPSVTLYIKSPSEQEATWICKEAFWDDAFPPPKASTVLWWLLTKNLFNQIRYVLGIYKDPASDKTWISEEDKKIEEERKRKQNKPPESLIFSAKTDAKLSYNKFKIESTSTLILIFPLALITYFVLSLIWICQFIPSIGPLEKVLKWVRKLDPFLSNSLGDVQKYIEHGVWSANARERLQKIIIAMLNDDYGTVEDITIIAHSMGCVVTYDALADGGEVAMEIKKIKDKKLKDNPKWKQKKITFVSVGSGINQVFRLAKESNTYAKNQFSRRLAEEITGWSARGKTAQHPEDQFYWLDIYARRDPVPAGELEKYIITQAQISHELQLKRRKVINTNNIMFDHTSYWANKDTVMPRIARAINGGREYPWPKAGITDEKLSRRIKYAARFSWLTKIVVGAVIAGLVVFLSLQLTGVL